MSTDLIEPSQDSKAGDATPPARLNPFAFPSDTDLRFVLLIVAVLSTSLLVYANMYTNVPLTASYRQAEYNRCTRLYDPSARGSPFERGQRLLDYSQCTANADRAQAVSMLAGVALVVAIGISIYWTSPRRRIS